MLEFVFLILHNDIQVLVLSFWDQFDAGNVLVQQWKMERE